MRVHGGKVAAHVVIISELGLCINWTADSNRNVCRESHAPNLNRYIIYSEFPREQLFFIYIYQQYLIPLECRGGLIRILMNP